MPLFSARKVIQEAIVLRQNGQIVLPLYSNSKAEEAILLLSKPVPLYNKEQVLLYGRKAEATVLLNKAGHTALLLKQAVATALTPEAVAIAPLHQTATEV